MHKVVFATALSAGLVISSMATAMEVRKKIGEWGDPFTPPQSRTSCIGYASGNWPWPAHGGWKTCNQWKTEWKHMEVEGDLVISGPDLDEAGKEAATTCALTAFAAAAGTGVASAGAGAAAAIAAAKVAFAACLSAKGVELADKFNITVDTRSHWTDWG